MESVKNTVPVTVLNNALHGKRYNNVKTSLKVCSIKEYNSKLSLSWAKRSATDEPRTSDPSIISLTLYH